MNGLLRLLLWAGVGAAIVTVALSILAAILDARILGLSHNDWFHVVIEVISAIIAVEIALWLPQKR